MSKVRICQSCNRSFDESLKQKAFCSSTCKQAYVDLLTKKTCRGCDKVKMIAEFQSAKSTLDGYANFCRNCIHERWKKWYTKNNVEKQALNAARNQSFVAAAGPDYLFQRRLARYGLSEKRYAELLAKFDGKCHSCQAVPATDIDHDHNTGKVRGLLCSPCNLGIGNLGDTLERVEAAYRYLLRHHATSPAGA